MKRAIGVPFDVSVAAASVAACLCKASLTKEPDQAQRLCRYMSTQALLSAVHGSVEDALLREYKNWQCSTSCLF
ncbi:TPA: hypothetical protein ACH3X3_004723 [Trebouxia sp. C0006]